MENEPRPVEEVRDPDLPETEGGDKRVSRLPLILTVVSLLLWFGFQTVELLVERSNLTSFKANLEAAMQEAQKVRTQFESLITKTAELAGKGNQSARAVVEELEKRGVPIKSTAQPGK